MNIIDTKVHPIQAPGLGVTFNTGATKVFS